MSRVKTVEASVSLFPFLSILTCTIGILTLLITLLSIGHLRGAMFDMQAVATTSPVEEYARLNETIEQTQEAFDEYSRRVAEAETIERRLGELKAEYDRLKAQRTPEDASVADVTAWLKEIEALRKRIAALTAELEAARRAVEAKRTAIVGLPKPGSTKIVPQKTYADSGPLTLERKPIFIECDARGLLLHPAGTRIGTSGVENSYALKSLLRTAESQAGRGALVVFLIRTTGVKAFDEARGVARNYKRLRYGYLPIPGSGDLDLSAFADSPASTGTDAVRGARP